MAHRNQGAAFLARLHQQQAIGKAGHQAVTEGKVVGQGFRLGGILADHRAALFDDSVSQGLVFYRVHALEPRTQDADGAPLRVQGAQVGRGINPPRQAADDGHPLGGQLSGDLVGLFPAIARFPAGTHDGDGQGFLYLQAALIKQQFRRVRNLRQQRREMLLPGHGQLDAGLLQGLRQGLQSEAAQP